MKTKRSERFVRLETLWIGTQHLLVQTGGLCNPTRLAEPLCILKQLIRHVQTVA